MRTNLFVRLGWVACLLLMGVLSSAATETKPFSPLTAKADAVSQTAPVRCRVAARAPNGNASAGAADASTPCVQFGQLAAHLQVVLTPTLGLFNLDAPFVLGAASAGIDPLTEPVVLKLAGKTLFIRPGSFRQDGQDYVFTGTINHVALEVQIKPESGNAYVLQAAGITALTALPPDPCVVDLTIGSNTGSVLSSAPLRSD